MADGAWTRGRGTRDHGARRTGRRAAGQKWAAGAQAPVWRHEPEPTERYAATRTPSAHAAPALEQPGLARDGERLPLHTELGRVNHLVADHDRPASLLRVRLRIRLH